MKKVFITGISGFTGKYIKKELEKYYEVYGTTLNENNVSEKVIFLDITKEKSLQKILNDIMPDYVINLAGISFVEHGNVEDLYQANLIGVRNLLSCLSNLEKKPKSVLLASSANVYGNSKDEPITELTEINCPNDYAISKYAMEKVASLWMDKLSIIIVRPFNYIGVGQSRQFLIPKIIRSFQMKNEYIELGDTSIRRDFSDVRDVVIKYKKLIEVSPKSLVVNICSSKSYSIDEIILMMNKIAGYEIKVKKNKKFIRKNEIRSLKGKSLYLENLIGKLENYEIFETLKWIYEEEVN